ncbi:MAG: hypothetical protein ACKO0Z_13545 [Betaproteobacteria bacterium]
MSPEQAAAFVTAQAAALNCEVQGMIAENAHRLSCGNSIAYGADEFHALLQSYPACTHNGALEIFREANERG